MIASSERIRSENFSCLFSEDTSLPFQFYASLSVTIILNVLLLSSFYDTTWVPADDGIYAHLGERILSGEILNKDIQSIHPGFINFVNAASLWMFGPQLVSLRIPLIFIGLLQAVVVHLLFCRLIPWLGIIASVSLTALGILQFFNPTAHWYCHVLFVVLIGVLHWTRPSNSWRVLCVGFLIGTIYLFRQFSGVIGGIGLLTYLLMETSNGKDLQRQEFFFARILLGLMGLGVIWYFFSHESVLDFLLFGLCPVAVIGIGFYSTTCPNRDTVRIVWQLSLGAFLSLLPLLVYHGSHDSLVPWISDTVFRAINLSQLPLYSQREYGQLIAFSLYTLSHASGVTTLINGTYLFLLPFLSLLNGGMVLWTVYKNTKEGREGNSPSALPFLAMFYAVVSIIYPIAIYLYLTIGLSLLGIVWQCYESRRARTLGLVLSIFLAIVAVTFHAGQPLKRSWTKFMQGEQIALAAVPDLGRSGLKIEPLEGETYSQLIGFIQQHTNQSDPIFVFPNNAELYFLADRPNPFRFYNLALDVTNESEGQAFIQSLKTIAPALIIFNSSDKYNTEVSNVIAAHIRETYIPIKEIGKFEIFSLSKL
jgi:heme/copper-type cytochrome/quinol oxidase subunit 4